MTERSSPWPPGRFLPRKSNSAWKSSLQKVFVLFGPTASGKTAILYRLFGGVNPVFPAEIVSADSMQVYRGMDRGTAKPSIEERAALVHHLIDIRNPDEQFNTGDFVRLAAEACAGIAGRGKLPVISGGTGFYIKNFIQGLPESPPANADIRAALKRELEQKGAAALMEELAVRDPQSAARIHPNDHYRLRRALEVCRLGGKPLSSYRTSSEEARFSFLVIGLRREREELYRRIDQRCAEMFHRGLPAEVKGLFDAGYTPVDPGLRAIGYREFFTEDPAGAGRWGFCEDTEAVKTLVAQNSRRYAKRQLTYFASIPPVHWLDAPDTEQTLSSIRIELEKFLETR